jgi:hypothetical protein
MTNPHARYDQIEIDEYSEGLSGGQKLRIAIARALPKKAPGHASPWAHLKGQVLLGSDTFVATITPQLKTSESKKEISKVQRRFQRSPLKRLLAGVKTRESRNRLRLSGTRLHLGRNWDVKWVCTMQP